jgi:hypothetical protein
MKVDKQSSLLFSTAKNACENHGNIQNAVFEVKPGERDPDRPGL